MSGWLVGFQWRRKNGILKRRSKQHAIQSLTRLLRSVCQLPKLDTSLRVPTLTLIKSIVWSDICNCRTVVPHGAMYELRSSLLLIENFIQTSWRGPFASHSVPAPFVYQHREGGDLWHFALDESFRGKVHSGLPACIPWGWSSRPT